MIYDAIHAKSSGHCIMCPDISTHVNLKFFLNHKFYEAEGKKSDTSYYHTYICICVSKPSLHKQTCLNSVKISYNFDSSSGKTHS